MASNLNRGNNSPRDSSSQPLPPERRNDFTLQEYLNDRTNPPFLVSIGDKGHPGKARGDFYKDAAAKSVKSFDAAWKRASESYKGTESPSSSVELSSSRSSDENDNIPDLSTLAIIDHSGGREHKGPRPPTPEPRPSHQPVQKQSDQENNPKCHRGHEVIITMSFFFAF